MMKSVEIRIRVTPQPDIEPGEYNAILMIEAEAPKTKRAPLNLPVVDLGPWPENLSLRREDLYDDEP